MNKLIHLIIISLFCTSITVAQEEGDNLKDYAGHVSYKYKKFLDDAERLQQFNRQEEDAIKVKMESLNKFLQSDKLVIAPKGVELYIASQISEKPPLSTWCKSLKSEISLTAYPWFTEAGKPVCECVGCNVSFTIYINRPDKVFNGMSITGGDDVLDADGVVMNLEPKQIGEQDNCKFYENEIAIIAGEKPLWLPVTVKTYDEALIRKYLNLNKTKPDDAMGNNMVIDKITDEMKAFTAEELNSTAYIGDKIGACPKKLNNEQSRAIVKLNPDYFDNSKSRTAVQLMVMECAYITAAENNELYTSKDELTFQATKLIEIMKSLKLSELKKYFD